MISKTFKLYVPNKVFFGNELLELKSLFLFVTRFQRSLLIIDIKSHTDTVLELSY